MQNLQDLYQISVSCNMHSINRHRIKPGLFSFDFWSLIIQQGRLSSVLTIAIDLEWLQTCNRNGASLGGGMRHKQQVRFSHNIVYIIAPIACLALALYQSILYYTICIDCGQCTFVILIEHWWLHIPLVQLSTIFQLVEFCPEINIKPSKILKPQWWSPSPN